MPSPGGRPARAVKAARPAARPRGWPRQRPDRRARVRAHVRHRAARGRAPPPLRARAGSATVRAPPDNPPRCIAMSGAGLNSMRPSARWMPMTTTPKRWRRLASRMVGRRARAPARCAPAPCSARGCPSWWRAARSRRPRAGARSARAAARRSDTATARDPRRPAPASPSHRRSRRGR